MDEGTSGCAGRGGCSASGILSMRSRMTPSRSAHGQISSSWRSKMSMQASATSAPGTIWWVRDGETPGSTASFVGGHRDQLGDPLRQVRQRQRARRPAAPSPAGAAPQIRASDRKVLDVAAALSGRPARSSWPASRAISARILRRSVLEVVLVGLALREVLAAPAGPRPAAPTRRRPATRPRRRRSRASRRRCRRPTAGRPTSRTSGVRRGTSGAPRPRRTARRCGRRSSRARGRAPGRCCPRRARPRSRSRRPPRSPCPRRPRPTRRRSR